MHLYARGTKRKIWKPTALQPPILVVTVLLSWALIAVLQYELVQSQRDNGIIFAPRINDLPLSRTFIYLYFPTILAVIFSIYWSWIDLQTKRMEPYYQLSKENGALGKDSLLLHYPFSFIPLVPVKAFRDRYVLKVKKGNAVVESLIFCLVYKSFQHTNHRLTDRRHWPVFWASFAVVLVTWGLVPTQAGIFSVRQVTRTTNTTFSITTAAIPIEKQAQTLTFRYAQSTYGIATLNETLPAFMARKYALAPFEVVQGDDSSPLDEHAQWEGNFTAPTTMYFLELFCEDVSHKSDNSTRIHYRSNSGCNFPLGLDGNLTVGPNPHRNLKGETFAIKQYTGFHAGFKDPQGFSDYSLDRVCPKNQTTIIYAAFQKNKARAEDPPNDVTAVFCQPRYLQQSVSATVNMRNLEPVAVVPLGEKKQIAPGIFNSSTFEILATAASFGTEVRGDVLPAKTTPIYLEALSETNLGLTSGAEGGSLVMPMVGLSVAVSNRPLEDLLDWKVLGKAYADAYRLMFARVMVEVLNVPKNASEPPPSFKVPGQTEILMDAVVLEPVFVYIVEGFLGVVSLSTLALLYLSITRKKNLRSNPGTIAGIMSLVADCEPLLSEYQGLDCCTLNEMKKFVGEKRYRLINDDTRTGIVELPNSPVILNSPQSPMLPYSRRNTPSDIAKPVRPFEFSVWTAFPLVSLFIALLICLTLVFVKARVQGLPLPSSSSLVQNILENYIPTAIATLIEPIWLLINRLICMLQPIEELQSCSAKANKSIDLDYSSLPPQLVVLKALRSKHYVLAAVCSMALLANLLAVTFAGLFFQATINIPREAGFTLPLDLKFVSINGDVGPAFRETFGSMQSSGAYKGGNGEDHFLVSESNYTRGTPLPAWTDDRLFYLPFLPQDPSISNKGTFEAVTRAFGAELDCNPLEFGDSFQAELEKTPGTGTDRSSVNITVTRGSSKIQCTSNGTSAVRPGPIGGPCVTGPSSVELTITLTPSRPNATREEIEACMEVVVLGWLRDEDRGCGNQAQPLVKANSTFMQCKLNWLTGTAKIRVDTSGRLQQKAQDVTLQEIATEDVPKFFSNDPVNLIGQSNLYIFRGQASGWHNDSFADDFLNYFIIRKSESFRLTDPNQPVPTFDMIKEPLNKAYSGLFAVWLGIYKDRLLTAHDAGQKVEVQGSWLQSETRLFISTPMFIISEIILCMYIIVAVLVYLRRPGKYLPNMPTSIASVIALFAASSMVLDMRNTSYLDGKERAKYLEKLDDRYGYGSFIGGGDGRVHIGIEKTPFVRARPRAGWWERKAAASRKGTNTS